MKEAKDVIKRAGRLARAKADSGRPDDGSVADMLQRLGVKTVQDGLSLTCGLVLGARSSEPRSRGVCSERQSDGSGGFDACGEPAVIRVESGLLCASCAEESIRRFNRMFAAVREAVR